MLRSINIKGFKSLKDASIEFGRVNLFIGGNGSGKSNILEAIGVSSAALSRGVNDIDLKSKGIRLTPPALMKSAFKNETLGAILRIECILDEGVGYKFSLEASDSSASLAFRTEKCYITGGGRNVFGRGPRSTAVLGETISRPADSQRGLWDQLKFSRNFSEPVSRQLDSLSSYSIYSPQTEFLRQHKEGAVDRPPIGLHGEGLGVAVNSLIGQWRKYRFPGTQNRDKANKWRSEALDIALGLVSIPGWTQSVKVGRPISYTRSRGITTPDDLTVFFVDKYMHKSRNTLTAYDSSEGTLYLLFMAVLLAHAESPEIFAVDNVDNALNPRMTRQMVNSVIRSVKQKQKYALDIGPDQVFLTSHNPTALDAFDIFDDEQRIFVVSRDGRGHTLVERLKPSEDMTRQEWDLAMKGRNLSQLWIDGEIGGALGFAGGQL